MGLREQARAVIKAREAYDETLIHTKCVCSTMTLQRDGCQCDYRSLVARAKADLDLAVQNLAEDVDPPGEPTLIIDDPAVILKVAGKYFRCSCGANVFRRFTNGQYQCNACKTLYEGE